MPADKPADKPADSTKKTTEKEAASEAARAQKQVIDAIKRTQEATLEIVSAWSESVSKLTDKLPEMPKLPLVDKLPKPHELSDQFFEFAQELMHSQQEFVKKLIDALPGHEKHD